MRLGMHGPAVFSQHRSRHGTWVASVDKRLGDGPALHECGSGGGDACDDDEPDESACVCRGLGRATLWIIGTVNMECEQGRLRIGERAL